MSTNAPAWSHTHVLIGNTKWTQRDKKKKRKGAHDMVEEKIFRGSGDRERKELGWIQTHFIYVCTNIKYNVW